MKPKAIAALIAVPLALIAVLLLTLGVRHILKNRVPKGPVPGDAFDFSAPYLCRVSWRRGAGSLGDSSSLELTMEPDAEGRPIVRVFYSDQPSHNAREVKKTVRVSSDTVRGVEEIIDRYGMRDWTDLPPREEFALDAPSSSFTIRYSDGTSVTVDGGDEVPEGCWEAIPEIRAYILSQAGIGE